MRRRALVALVLVVSTVAAVAAPPGGGFRPPPQRPIPRPVPRPIPGRPPERIVAGRTKPVEVRVDAFRMMRSQPHQVFELLSLERTLINEAERTRLARQAIHELSSRVRAKGVKPDVIADLDHAARHADFDPALIQELKELARQARSRMLVEILDRIDKGGVAVVLHEAAAMAAVPATDLDDNDEDDRLWKETLKALQTASVTVGLTARREGLRKLAVERWNPDRDPGHENVADETALQFVPESTVRQMKGLRALTSLRRAMLHANETISTVMLEIAVLQVESALESDLAITPTEAIGKLKQELALLALLRNDRATHERFTPKGKRDAFGILLRRELRNAIYGEGEVTTPALRRVVETAGRNGPPPVFAALLGSDQKRTWQPPKPRKLDESEAHLVELISHGRKLHEKALRGMDVLIAEAEKDAKKSLEPFRTLREKATARDGEREARLTDLEKPFGRPLTPGEQGRALVLLKQKKTPEEIVAALKRQGGVGEIADVQQFCEQTALLLGRPLMDAERTRCQAAFKDGKTPADIAEELDNPQ